MIREARKKRASSSGSSLRPDTKLTVLGHRHTALLHALRIRLCALHVRRRSSPEGSVVEGMAVWGILNEASSLGRAPKRKRSARRTGKRGVGSLSLEATSFSGNSQSALPGRWSMRRSGERKDSVRRRRLYEICTKEQAIKARDRGWVGHETR